MKNSLIHLTTQGERWDNLAWRYYRDPYGYESIIKANPDVALYPVLPGGLRLVVPIQARSTSLTPEMLPPWLR